MKKSTEIATAATLTAAMFAATGASAADTEGKPSGLPKRLELEVYLDYTAPDTDDQNGDFTDTGLVLHTPIIQTPKWLVNLGLGYSEGDSFGSLTVDRELFDIPNLTFTAEVTDELPFGDRQKGALGFTWHKNADWRARGQSGFTTFIGAEKLEGEKVQAKAKVAYRF